ncbi:hypothetical protein NESM_000533800 [Novymonas esmeraldas]|uniref:Chromo domain-containing protein n=1 Tax=Novymonas esmeraldas TaxID=1808958 RepID=A0AAW0EQL5_9TRYP
MTYYAVDEIADRRIHDDDGTIEYAVRWAHCAGEVTWEKRQQLTDNCAAMVQAVDQRCMDATDQELEQWRDEVWSRADAPTAAQQQQQQQQQLSDTASTQRKRGRSTSPPVSGGGGELPEMLNGVLLRPMRGDSEAGHEEEAEEEGILLMLGEVVLAEEASAALNRGASHLKKRKSAATSAAVSLHTAPALEVEKRWRDTHGQSLLHSIDAARTIVPFHPNFRLHRSDPATRQALALEAERSSHLRIISIAPPLATRSGAVFAEPVSLDSLVGEKDVEQLRLSVQLESPLLSGVAQELARPHVEQMVVRYIVPEPTAAVAGGSAGPAAPLLPAQGRIACMPLSVFRVVFPQLLIDFLLENSLVLR